MKNKITAVLIIGLIFSFNHFAFAQQKQATSSPDITSTKVADEDIANFKEKIASKVAELTKKQQKAVSGFVDKIGTSQLTIKTEENKNYQIKIDDILTKIYQVIGTQKKEIKLSQIEKGDYLIIDGPVNDLTISANYIFLDEKYLVKVGKITEVDKDNYSLKILTSDKETINLDIETSTKQLILDIKSLELLGMGFSKIKEGDTIHFVTKNGLPGDKTNFSAIKIILVPQEYFIK